MSITTRFTKILAQRCLPDSLYAEQLHSKDEKERAKQHLYLTFDDGPHPERTPLLLDQLAILEIKATFFILGRNIHNGKDIIRRALSEGHSVGSHSWSHLRADETSNKVWIEDVAKARRELEDVSGKNCRLFRPPYGALSPLKLLHLINNDYHIIQWSMDTKDFAAKSPKELTAWFEHNSPSPGEILLMHDDKENTARNFKDAYLCWHDKFSSRAIPMT